MYFLLLHQKMEKNYQGIEKEINERRNKIKSYLNNLLNEISFYSEKLKEAGEWYFKNGGKLLRPLLYLFGCDEVGENYQNDRHLKNAAALEMIHVSTLVHDDIIDKSSLRRGKSTVHKKFGHDMGILCGDVLFSYAVSITRPQNTMKELCRLYNTICDGQALEMQLSEKILKEKVDPQKIYDEYLNMISLKTAEFFGVALSLSAKKSKKKKLLYYIGKEIGKAFQMADDIHDILYTHQKWREDFASDLKENKPTILYVLAKKEGIDILEIYKERKRNHRNHVKAARDVYRLLKEKKIIDNAIDNMESFLLKAEEKIDNLENQTIKMFLAYLNKKIKDSVKM